jgi:hypothetical protein
MKECERTTGSKRARALADRLAAANEDLVSLVEQLTERQWRAVTSAEGWPVGVVADHVAQAYPSLLNTLSAVIDGAHITATRAQVDQANAQHAAAFGDRDRVATLVALRRDGAALVDFIASLTDIQLATRGRVPLLREEPASVDEVLERLVLPHTEVHLQHIRQTIADGAEEQKIA